MYHSYCPYLFIHQWTFRLFPCLGYCKLCCIEREDAGIFSEWFHFLCTSTQKWNRWIIDSSIFNFLRNLRTIFQSGYINLHSSNSALRFPFLHIMVNTYLHLFNSRHSNRHEVISHCSFDLHFPDDEWRWPPFHVLFFPHCILLASLS